jgi:integrase/recombinase XerD
MWPAAGKTLFFLVVGWGGGTSHKGGKRLTFCSRTFGMEVVMLECFFLMPKTVDRIMGCWLGPQIDQYVTVLCEQGYAARSIYRRVPILTSFADFAAARHVDQIDQAEALVDAFVAKWLSARCADGSADARWRSRNFIGVTVRHFFSLVVWKSEYSCNRTVWADPFAVQVPGFFDHLREERGLRPRSICAYRHYLRRFERYLENIGCELAALSLPVVTGYITTVAQQFGSRSMVNIAGTLRVFLRYLHRKGLLQRDISKQVEVPQHYRLADFRDRSVGIRSRRCSTRSIVAPSSAGGITPCCC